MKKLIILCTAILLTGCASNNVVCEKPASLHPVLSCEDCHWQEL